MRKLVPCLLVAVFAVAVVAASEVIPFTSVPSQADPGMVTYNVDLTGGYNLGLIDWSGFASTLHDSTYGSELMLGLSGPLGSTTFQLGTGTSYAPGAAFAGSSELFNGAGDPAGTWTFDFYESYDDGSDGLPDAVWDYIDFTFNDYIPPPPPVYTFNMDTDPGWTTEGQWEFGVPLGQGGEYGNPDPTGGCTGDNVYGYNLAGDYGVMSETEWLTTSALDFSDYTNVELDFCRWLNVESDSYDHAYIEVSSDGVNWTQIWENDGTITDDAWQMMSYDISALADGEATVYVRWGMGPTDSSWFFSGWNIDDVVFSGIPEPASLALLALGGLALLRRR